METAYKVHSMKGDDHKMWHLGWGSSSCPIPIYSAARSFIAPMIIACLLCAGHRSSHWILQWTRQSPAVRKHLFHGPVGQWTSNYVIKCQVARPGWGFPAELLWQPTGRPLIFQSPAFPAQDPPCFVLSKDSNEGVKHMERKSYCSGFPLFKTS